MLRWIEYLDKSGEIKTLFLKVEFKEQVIANCRPVQVELHFPENGTETEIIQFIDELKTVRENVALELRNQVELSILLAILYKKSGGTNAALEEMENALDYLSILIFTKKRSLNRLSNMQDLTPSKVPEFGERISALLKEKKVLEEKIQGITKTIGQWKNAC